MLYFNTNVGATLSRPGALADGGTARQLAAASIAENTRRAYASLSR